MIQQRSLASRRSAVFDSHDARYRYRLEREFSEGCGTVHFLMLNGSTATAEYNDATVSKVERYALAWGYRRLIVTNLFAFMARHPERLTELDDPVGPQNDQHILQAVRDSLLTVCAWGDFGTFLNRAAKVRTLIQSLSVETMRGQPTLSYLRLNASGQPAHPIYLPAALKPQRWVLS